MASGFMAFLEDNADGVPDDALRQQFKENYANLVPIINDLLQQGRLNLFNVNGVIVYKAIKADIAEKFKGLAPDDMLVYQHIEKAHDMGIWTRDIKNRTGMQQAMINKILKRLESKRLVKSVKSIASKTRKLYILYGTRIFIHKHI